MRKLRYQFTLIQAMRNFFNKEGFTDVMTPPMVQNPGMEPHIHPFQVKSTQRQSDLALFLHTSPEFAMKKILAQSDLQDIFTLTYCFRDEPKSQTHRNQFIMCEWYRKDAYYTKIMDDCENLIDHCNQYLIKNSIETNQSTFKFNRETIQNTFLEFLNMDILNFLDTSSIKRKIQLDFKDVPLPEAPLNWDDYYFLLFLNKIEPLLKNYPYLLLYQFPHHLKSLSTINSKDPRVCDRFEIYMNGIEVCNCFNELTNFQEQKERFEIDHGLKLKEYGYSLPEPTEFYQTLQKGLPISSGIALGVERLLMSLTKEQDVFFD